MFTPSIDMLGSVYNATPLYYAYVRASHQNHQNINMKSGDLLSRKQAPMPQKRPCHHDYLSFLLQQPNTRERHVFQGRRSERIKKQNYPLKWYQNSPT